MKKETGKDAVIITLLIIVCADANGAAEIKI
jgi:hypothetical protein